jgi:hypothetical protein
VGSRTGLDDLERRNILSLPGLELQFLDRPVRVQPLCRLRYHKFMERFVIDYTGLFETIFENTKEIITVRKRGFKELG